jgi:hypothetical protein
LLLAWCGVAAFGVDAVLAAFPCVLGGAASAAKVMVVMMVAVWAGERY